MPLRAIRQDQESAVTETMLAKGLVVVSQNKNSLFRVLIRLISAINLVLYNWQSGKLMSPRAASIVELPGKPSEQ